VIVQAQCVATDRRTTVANMRAVSPSSSLVELREATFDVVHREGVLPETDASDRILNPVHNVSSFKDLLVSVNVIIKRVAETTKSAQALSELNDIKVAIGTRR
jgi:hypothetical protein